MPSGPESGKEFAGLEIARFLSALAVMFWHYQHFFYKGVANGGDTAPAEAVTFPLHRLFGFFYDNGHYAAHESPHFCGTRKSLSVGVLRCPNGESVGRGIDASAEGAI
jgi:hypothetical protein